MSAHTPGPWFQEPDAPLIVSTDDYQIAHCLPKPAEGEAEANARLIAAAPDLLVALILVRDADNDCRADGLPTIPAPARAMIDAAIAKAEGGA